jgi:hypothetical protein
MASTNSETVAADPSSEGTRIFSLTIPGRLPSWNQVLALSHWQRIKLKKGIADAFLCALRASAVDCSTRTICAKNSTLTYLDTLELFLKTARSKRESKSASKRLARANLKEPKSRLAALGACVAQKRPHLMKDMDAQAEFINSL